MNNCIVCGRESDALIDDICPDCHMDQWRQSLIPAFVVCPKCASQDLSVSTGIALERRFRCHACKHTWLVYPDDKAKTDFKEGGRVRLRQLTKELKADGLHLDQTGTIRVLEGKWGVEFDGYSDSGWNAGLQVIKFNARADHGSIVPILALCEVILPGQDSDKGIVARPGASV